MNAQYSQIPYPTPLDLLSGVFYMEDEGAEWLSVASILRHFDLSAAEFGLFLRQYCRMNDDWEDFPYFDRFGKLTNAVYSFIQYKYDNHLNVKLKDQSFDEIKRLPFPQTPLRPEAVVEGFGAENRRPLHKEISENSKFLENLKVFRINYQDQLAQDPFLDALCTFIQKEGQV
ncbi:MAG: hypothetical protein ACFFFG_18410 [Candidatus Thorarchaeota archaeon]